MSYPILYSFRRCPYAARARLALIASGVVCELREIVLRAKPAQMLAVSPKGTVPVLITPAGEVIEQSLDIMLWALLKNEQNDPQRWLQPEQGSLDAMLALIAANDSNEPGGFKYHLDRYKYPNRYQPDATLHAAFSTAHRAAGSEFLAHLEMLLAERGGYLFGSRPALADMAIAPFVRQFSHVEKSAGQDWFAAQPWPALHAWLGQILASPLYATALTKFVPWQEGDAPTLFPACDSPPD